MLTNYIVFHDEHSLNWFMSNNPELWPEFDFILVGEYDAWPVNLISKCKHSNMYLANAWPNNIEQHKSLLTFTVWYLLANNHICKTDYVGIFEYDVIFEKMPEPELKEDRIYGFVKRELPDRHGLYLDAIPSYHFADDYTLKQAQKENYWNASTNFIMPFHFLIDFVGYYYNKVIDMIDSPNHPKISHYHERIINLYAFINDYKNISLNGLIHKEHNSHKIRL